MHRVFAQQAHIDKIVLIYKCARWRVMMPLRGWVHTTRVSFEKFVDYLTETDRRGNRKIV